MFGPVSTSTAGVSMHGGAVDMPVRGGLRTCCRIRLEAIMPFGFGVQRRFEAAGDSEDPGLKNRQPLESYYLVVYL